MPPRPWIPSNASCDLFRTNTLPDGLSITAAFLFGIAGERCMFGKHKIRGWSLPGGHIEAGEDVIDGLRRECIEEAGISFIESKLFGVVRIEAPGKATPSAKYPNPSGMAFFYAEVKVMEWQPMLETEARALFALDDSALEQWHDEHHMFVELFHRSRSVR